MQCGTREFMSGALTDQIYDIMEREMSSIGHFIVKKQCMLIGADPGNIEPPDLPELASKLSEVMRTFGGYEKARKIFSEIKQLENLDLIVEAEESEEKRNKMLEDLGRTCLFAGEWEKAFEYFNQLLAEAENAGDKRLMSRYLRRLGFIHQERAEFDQALDYYERALEEAEESGNKNAIAGSCNYIGNIYWNKGNYDKSIEYHERAIYNAKDVDDKKAMGAAHIGLGNVHSDINEMEESIKHFKESIGYLKEVNQLDQLARAYNNLGDTYLRMDKWTEALKQFEKCLKYGEEGGWLNMKAWAFFNSSEALINLNELAKAEENLDQSHEILKTIGDKAGIAAVHQNYGRLYKAKSDFDLTIRHFEKAVEIFTEINTPLSLAECRVELASAFKTKGDLKRAKEEYRRAANLFHHLELDKRLKDVLKEIEKLD